LYQLANKTAGVLSQNSGSFGSKKRQFWVVFVGVFEASSQSIENKQLMIIVYKNK